MNRHATAIWKGTLTNGTGELETQSGALSHVPYSFKTRFEDETGKSGTNPEELIAAAHAGCFAMQLSHLLAENGTAADRLQAEATVTLGPAAAGGFEITRSAIVLVATVPGIVDTDFQALANKAKQSCPVSKALAAIEVTLDARLA